MPHPRNLSSVSSADMAVLDGLISENWPDVWREFAAVFYTGLLNSPELNAGKDLLARTAIEQVYVLGRQLGGTQPYVPRGAIVAARDAAQRICRDFRGNNYAELASREELTESRVRQILYEEKKRGETERAAAQKK